MQKPLYQADGGNDRQARHKYEYCPSQSCEHFISFYTEPVKKLSDVLSVVSQQPLSTTVLLAKVTVRGKKQNEAQ